MSKRQSYAAIIEKSRRESPDLAAVPVVPLAILNTSILTDYGAYTYRWIALEDARAFVGAATNVQSFVGHESTAVILSELLGAPIAVHRGQYQQSVGASAIVFKLRGRAPEGKILSRVEVEAIGYDFGLLTRTE
jgi:hypothetical protein